MKMENRMRREQILIVGVLVIFLAAFIPGCIETSESKGMVKEEFNGEYPTNENTILTVENINGNIDITGWSGDKITLDAEEKVDKKYKSQLDDVEVNVTEDVNSVIIKAIYNTEKRDVTVTMTIKVPHAVTVEKVKDVNGNVGITDVKGDCEVSVTNGEININDVDGYVTAQMTNGDIDIKDTTGISEVSNTNGDIKAEIYNLRANVEVTNTNGDVTIYILPSLDANITLETENGKVKVNDLTLEYTVNEDKHVIGSLGLGIYKVNLVTTNGNVNLNKLS
jgi:hypothetical protein